ncbi:MAG: hypothetical protein QMB88_04345, partial [Burkholderiaceae bacterium]
GFALGKTPAAGWAYGGRFDVSERNRAAFEAAGVHWCDSATACVAAVDLVWLMVVSGEHAEDFLCMRNMPPPCRPTPC